MNTTTTFPPTTAQDILAFQFSSWYPTFAQKTFKSTIIRPLDDAFVRYLNADGVVVPKGSDSLEGANASGAVNGANGHGRANGRDVDSDEDDTDDDTNDEHDEESYSFPDLDAQIRAAIAFYGAVFPKLNFSAPKDASWILPSSSPLKCTSPMDVYILLKSSDFVSYDLDVERVFDGCAPAPDRGGGEGGGRSAEMETEQEMEHPKYELELVLRKWYHVDPGREFRCFVREKRLIGITQRDTNYYDYLNSLETQEKIERTISGFWEREIRDKWKTDHYTFDLILTRDLESAHILDFNPFLPRTDPLLFSYDDLHAYFLSHSDSEPVASQSQNLGSSRPSRPILRVIDSRSHPSATRSSPANVHNMVPFDMLSLGEGRSVDEFERVFGQQVRAANNETDEDSDG